MTGDVDLVEVADGRAADLDVDRSVGRLRVIALDVQCARRIAGIELAGVEHVGVDRARSGKRAPLDVDG